MRDWRTEEELAKEDEDNVKPINGNAHLDEPMNEEQDQEDVMAAEDAKSHAARVASNAFELLTQQHDEDAQDENEAELDEEEEEEEEEGQDYQEEAVIDEDRIDPGTGLVNGTEVNGLMRGGWTDQNGDQYGSDGSNGEERETYDDDMHAAFEAQTYLNKEGSEGDDAEDEEEEDFDEDSDIEGEEGDENADDEEEEEGDYYSEMEGTDEEGSNVGAPATDLIKGGTGVSAEDAFELSD